MRVRDWRVRSHMEYEINDEVSWDSAFYSFGFGQVPLRLLKKAQTLIPWGSFCWQLVKFTNWMTYEEDKNNVAYATGDGDSP